MSARPAQARRCSTLSAIDNVFLDVESDSSLMTIASLWFFQDSLTIEDVRGEFEKLIQRFPRFGHKLRQPLGSYSHWEEDLEFDLSSHIKRTTLSKPGDKKKLQEVVGELVSKPFDFKKPLWQAHVIVGVDLFSNGVRSTEAQNGRGCVLLTRLHHCITDGQGAIRMLLTLTSSPGKPDQYPTSCEKCSNDGSLGETKSEAGRRRGGDANLTAEEKRKMLANQYGKHNAKREEKMSTNEVRSRKMNFGTNEQDTERAKTVGESIAKLVTELFMIPSRLLVFFFGVFVFCLNYLYIMGTTRQNFVCNSRPPKSVGWSTKINLNDVKKIKLALNCTVNDVLVSCLCGALQTYLEKNSSSRSGVEKNILCGIPVSLRSWDDWSLGNKVCMANLWLPMDKTSPIDRLEAVKERMNNLKKGPDVLLSYNFMKVFSFVPKFLRSEWLVQRVLTRSHCLFTNVPGPREPLLFANRAIVEYVPFIPQPGARGGLGLAVLTYANNVTFSVLCDEGLLHGGPSTLTDEFEKQFAYFLEITSGAA
eukprot:Nk52_evm98s1073 gene=Nk52_evmTU98s1073